MTAPFSIWVDLDETLVATSEEQRPGWTQLRIGRFASLRPGAAECLHVLRQIGPVAMLTSARREYALAVCDAFPQLGFRLGDILSSEMWTSTFAEDPRVDRPGDVLIEDEGSHSLARKCRFLGIADDHAILVIPYRGEPDDALASVPQRVELVLRQHSGAAISEDGLAHLLRAEGGCVTVAEACRLFGTSPSVSPQELTDRIRAGTIIAYRPGGGEYAIPIWQFRPEGGVLPGLTDVLIAIRHKNPGPGLLSAFTFFLQADPLTDGRPPLEALRAGRLDQVLNAVEARG